MLNLNKKLLSYIYLLIFDKYIGISKLHVYCCHFFMVLVN